MDVGAPHTLSAGERLRSRWDDAKASFGLPVGVAMVVALVVGFGLPAVDAALDVELPVFEFENQDPARSLLGTIATVTVAVAGLAFSVTVVAFTLASSQLSPRVLRTFRGDRLSQATLACFLATFIYCLAVLVRLGATDNDANVPNLSITLAIVLAFTSFALFAAFIAHIVSMLQPSSIIADVKGAGRRAVEHRFPDGIGKEPEDPAAAAAHAHERMGSEPPRRVVAEQEGYLRQVRGDAIMRVAAAGDALVCQRALPGDYVVAGDTVAEVWGEVDPDHLVATFELADQRSPLQDVAFPVRQLADIALKGLSPGINDPTTAENAMDALTALLVRFVHGDPISSVRVDADGTPRFVAAAPSLDDLVELGFDQVRVFAAAYPVVSMRLLRLLERVARAAREEGIDHGAIERQAALIRAGADAEVPTDEDADRVRRADTALRAPDVL